MTRQEILPIAKPILFNTDMVMAILDGKKTETRRLIKPPYFVDGDSSNPKSILALRTAPKGSKIYRQIGEMPYPDKPYEIGDYLYVRETWSVVQIYGDNGTYGFDCVYAADNKILPVITNDFKKCCGWGKFFDKNGWNPSIHMPKEAARIFLRVTGVRVERLNDITEEEAVKEGLYKGWYYLPTSSLAVTAKQAFMWVWDMTIKLKDRHKYGWIANPWVWVIEFERLEVQ